MNTCPVCKKKTRYASWREEYYQVEYIYECLYCKQYKEHWSYGMFNLIIGKWEVNCHQDDSKILQEFHKRIKYYKNRIQK